MILQKKRFFSDFYINKYGKLPVHDSVCVLQAAVFDSGLFSYF